MAPPRGPQHFQAPGPPLRPQPDFLLHPLASPPFPFPPAASPLCLPCCLGPCLSPLPFSTQVGGSRGSQWTPVASSQHPSLRPFEAGHPHLPAATRAGPHPLSPECSLPVGRLTHSHPPHPRPKRSTPCPALGTAAGRVRQERRSSGLSTGGEPTFLDFFCRSGTVGGGGRENHCEPRAEAGGRRRASR